MMMTMVVMMMMLMMLISFWIVRVMHFMCSQIKHSGHNQKTSHPDDAIRQRKRNIFQIENLKGKNSGRKHIIKALYS